MLLDTDGKVQFDSFNALCGRRLQLPEVLRVLMLDETSAYGMHQPGGETVERMSGESGAEYVAYGAHELLGSRGRIGALLYVSRIQGMMDSLEAVAGSAEHGVPRHRGGGPGAGADPEPGADEAHRQPEPDHAEDGKGRPERPRAGAGQRRAAPAGGKLQHHGGPAGEPGPKSRNQFVSNASHELKTPLATMKIMLETMIYQPDMPGEVRQEFMEDMNHEIDRLTGIITDLLTLTRMDNQERRAEDGGDRSERPDGGDRPAADAGGGEAGAAAGKPETPGLRCRGPDEAEPGAVQSDRQRHEIHPGRGAGSGSRWTRTATA